MRPLRETHPPTMAQKTVYYGALLIIIGLMAYFGTGRESATALIPSFFGIPFIILGITGQRWPHARRQLMHVSMVLALIIAIGTIGGLIGLLRLLFGAEMERTAAAVAQGVTCLLSLAYLGMGVKTFIDIRRGYAGGENA